MKTIQLSDPCYQRLLERVRSFEDAPEDVIQNLLDETESDDRRSQRRQEIEEAVRQNRPRVSPGTILPEREYWKPILRIIVEREGSAPAGEVIAELGERLKDAFTPLDLQRLDTGAVRWRNRARFARLRMTQQGLLSKTSPRGIWTITDPGRAFLENG
jgi:Mrr N-terminal domain